MYTTLFITTVLYAHRSCWSCSQGHWCTPLCLSPQFFVHTVHVGAVVMVTGVDRSVYHHSSLCSSFMLELYSWSLVYTALFITTVLCAHHSCWSCSHGHWCRPLCLSPQFFVLTVHDGAVFMVTGVHRSVYHHSSLCSLFMLEL